jgi:hypothetical protein
MQRRTAYRPTDCVPAFPLQVRFPDPSRLCKIGGMEEAALWALLALMLIVSALTFWTFVQTLWMGIPPAAAILWREAKRLLRRR